MAIRRTRLGRLARLGGLAASVAGGAAGAGLSAVRHGTDAAATAVHAATARRFAETVGQMKGLPLKVGQLLSFLEDTLPEAHQETWRTALAPLKAHAPTLEWADVEPVLRAAWGEAYDAVAIDPEPVAAASIGQVYRARYQGVDLAVKVQYPGIADALRADLANAHTLVSALSGVLGAAAAEAVFQDVSSQLLEETDYRAEAAHQAAFAALWADDDDVVVPQVVAALSTDTVLVTEWVDGVEWEEALAAPEAVRRAWGRQIVRFAYGSLYGAGQFNADPHPGNYRFLPDGRVAFLDFGCVVSHRPAQRQALVALRDGFATGHADRAAAERFFGTGPLDDDHWALFADYLALTAEPFAAAQPYTFAADYARRLNAVGMQAKLTVLKSAARRRVPMPSEHGVVLLARINFGLAAVLGALGASLDVPAEVAAIEARLST